MLGTENVDNRLFLELKSRIIKKALDNLGNQLSKGQVISKANCQAVNSSKK